MNYWMKCLAATGIGSTIALANTASFAQNVGVEPDPFGYGVRTYEPYYNGGYDINGFECK